MNCQTSRDELWEWVHEEMDDAEQVERISRHVATCESCSSAVKEMRSLVADIEGLSGLLDEAPAAAPPERIGEYRIIRELGRGGMGVVFEAEQDTPRRLVALKVVRAGRLVDAYQARLFRREMQALARLNHPSIATIYDAGVGADGQSYLAMELVEGRTLTQRLSDTDGAPLTVRQRLQLFHRICEAVIHAHQRGIIHRDLKPTNIMVTADDQPKVLDFGLARATESDVNAATMVSEAGRLIGTLQYMSPEQARGDGDLIDVRTDVYALGVILYEMLTGVLPYDVTAAPLHESLRVICEKPPLNPRSLNRSAPRDVVTIVLKALEKDPARRFQTVADLADDVERYLTNHPIHARPASRAYRFAKLVQRHKMASGLLATIVLLAVGSAGIFAVQARRVSAERDVARREASKAEAINRFLRDMLASVDPRQALGRDVSVKEVVDRTARSVGDELRDQPEIEAGIRDTIGQVYNALTEHAAAEEQLTRALELRRSVHKGDHSEIADSLNHLAEARFARSDYEGAEAMVKEALAMRRRLFGENHEVIAESIKDLGSIAMQHAEFDRAESLMREALEMQRANLPPDDPAIATSYSSLALLLREQGRFDEAEGLLRDALKIHRARLGEMHPDVAADLNNLALVLRDKDDLEQAEQLYRQALATNRRIYGERHSTIAGNLSNLGRLFITKGDLRSAKDFLEQAVEMDRQIYGDEHPNVALGLNLLAVTAYKAGDADEAERMFLDALRIKRKIYGEEHPEIAADLNNLGVVRQSAGDLDKAEEYFRQALAVNSKVYGAEHPDVAANLANIGSLLAVRGDFAAAEEMQRRALAIRRKAFGQRHLEVANSLESLADTLLQAGQYADALRQARECIETRQAALGPDDWSAAVAEGMAGEALTALSDYEEAESRLLHSAKVLIDEFGEDDLRSQTAIERLASLYDAWGKPEQAAEWRSKLVSESGGEPQNP